jgi:hypothetical protein
MYGRRTDAHSTNSTGTAAREAATMTTASAVGGSRVGKATGQGGHRNAGIKAEDTFEKERLHLKAIWSVAGALVDKTGVPSADKTVDASVAKTAPVVTRTASVVVEAVRLVPQRQRWL